MTQRVRRDLHRLALVRRQEAAKGHASEKHRKDRQHHYAIVSRRRIKSPQLLVQKFLVVLVHFRNLFYEEMPIWLNQKFS